MSYEMEWRVLSFEKILRFCLERDRVGVELLERTEIFIEFTGILEGV
jgi:hypothetical protein